MKASVFKPSTKLFLLRKTSTMRTGIGANSVRGVQYDISWPIQLLQTHGRLDVKG